MSRSIRVVACVALLGCSGAIENDPFRGLAGPAASPKEPLPITSGGAGSGGAGSGPADDAEAEPTPPQNAIAGSAAPSPPSPSVASLFDAEPTCTSDYYWDKDELDGDRRMHPGRACIACHADHDGPSFVIGGTVFPSAHEPDQCLGFDGGDDEDTFVVITDATGAVLRLPVNATGNFESEDYEDEHAIVMPIHAKVVRGSRERVMAGERRTGDCNGCHTQDGANGAPGRIVAP